MTSLSMVHHYYHPQSTLRLHLHHPSAPPSPSQASFQASPPALAAAPAAAPASPGLVPSAPRLYDLAESPSRTTMQTRALGACVHSHPRRSNNRTCRPQFIRTFFADFFNQYCPLLFTFAHHLHPPHHQRNRLCRHLPAPLPAARPKCHPVHPSAHLVHPSNALATRARVPSRVG